MEEGQLLFSAGKLRNVRKQLFYRFLIGISVAELVLLCGISAVNLDGTVAQIVSSQSEPSTSFGNTSGAPTIQITSLRDGQQVQTGELMIEGISSDDNEKNCQVYADVNDNTPMRNATATGNSGDTKDFSSWTFKYTDEYLLISEGENELTAKISCFGVTNPSSGPLSEWHTVNVTGVPGTSEIIIVPVTPPSIPDSSTGDESDDGESDSEDTAVADEDDASQND